MQILLALIPMRGIACVVVFLKNKNPNDPTRLLLIHSAIGFGCYLVFCLEVLSIFKWITVIGIVIVWMLPIVAFFLWIWHKITSGEKVTLPGFQFPNNWWNRFLFLIICGVLIITALVAWVTPPQTWDSLTYHLS